MIRRVAQTVADFLQSVESLRHYTVDVVAWLSGRAKLDQLKTWKLDKVDQSDNNQSALYWPVDVSVTFGPLMCHSLNEQHCMFPPNYNKLHLHCTVVLSNCKYILVSAIMQ